MIANGEANEAKAELERITRRANTLEIALVGLVGVAVIVASFTAVVLVLGNRKQNQRIEDCTRPEGRCYQQTKRDTGAAVQTVLDYIDATMNPHRLRNEAENKCQVELFARRPTILDSGAEAALAEYDDCVHRRSGGTDPPPVPQNPLSTTTTRRP
jgi:hypothetical protein